MRIAAFSGGKDSTAMVLHMAESGRKPDILLITPTGNELPEMREHWNKISEMVGVPLTIPQGVPTLVGLIKAYGALPNWRQRWCTRAIKIVPALAYMRRAPSDSILSVGLRADEEDREGIYGEFRRDFPLRDADMKKQDVIRFLSERGVSIPRRTDCAWCYGQRLSEWRDLWELYPDLYQEAVNLEISTGHTFRSPGRDKWPASLSELAIEFGKGRKIRGDGSRTECRVCSL